MNILFISKHKWPHIGGVEKHIKEICFELQLLGCHTNTISEEDVKPPHIKLFGLLHIWYWLFKNRNLIKNSDLIHIHDVFIWYFPFRFIFPKKKVYITFHGWEGQYPIPLWNIINKRIANKLTNGSIAIGKYIEKYYGIKATYISYGAIDLKFRTNNLKYKQKNTMVYLGRQDSDTGYLQFLNWLKTQGNKMKVKFVTNDPNPEKYLKTAEYCVPSGYLSYLEAKGMGCKTLTFANNPLKVDYWKEIKKLKTIPTWSKVAEVYIKLWEK